MGGLCQTFRYCALILILRQIPSSKAARARRRLACRRWAGLEELLQGSCNVS